MSDSFQPLGPAPSNIPASASDRWLQLLDDAALTARSTPGAGAVGLFPPPAPVGAATRPSECEPQITVEKDGDRITHIHVQCTCGKVTSLRCEY